MAGDKDPRGVLPWHICHELEDLGITRIPTSLYHLIDDLLTENASMAETLGEIEAVMFDANE